jgi:hypothetical protein
MRFIIQDYDLVANVRYPVSIAGRYFTFVSVDAALDVYAYHKSGGSEVGKALGIDQGLVVPVLPDGFSRLDLVSTVNQTVKLAVSDDPVTATTVAGTVNVNATKVQGSTLGPVVAPIAVGDTATLLAAASASRKKIIFVNDDATDTVDLIDSAGVYGRGIPLAPGDLWEETDLAAAAWYGICNTGLSANVRVIVGS